MILALSIASCNYPNESVKNNSDEFPICLLKEDLNSILCKDSGFTQAVSVIDLNNDDYPELFATNTGIYERNLFYQNNMGVFIKDTAINVTKDQFRSHGCSWVDFDNNNSIDLVVANRDDTCNLLYINNKTFIQKILSSKNTKESWSYGTSWCDVNNDGYLDLYITNYNNQKNTFYQNINGQLIEKEINGITTANHSSLHATWCDLNNDLLQDLIVCEKDKNHIYINKGNFNFEQLDESNINTSASQTYGCSTADFNNDGLIDLFFSNWAGKNELFMNCGNLQFKKINSGEIALDYENSEGSCWGDFNNDGFIDLAVTNDGNNKLYQNINGKSFKSIQVPGFTDTVRNSNGVVWLDANNNGFLDLFVANGKNELNQFFKNIGNKNNYVKIQLIGSNSNLSAIGSKIKIYSNGKLQTQEVSAQSGGGCGSQKSLTLHFGIEKASKIDSLFLIWPSGKTHSFFDLKANTKHTLKE